MSILPLVPEESTLSRVDSSIYLDHTGKHYGILAYLLHRVGFPDEVIENMSQVQIEEFVCRLYKVQKSQINDYKFFFENYGYPRAIWYLKDYFNDPLKD